MRRLGKFLGRVILVLIIAGALLWVFGPRELVETDITFDPASLGEDLDAYLAAAEARFDDITPGVEKRIIWAGEVGQKTPLAVIYLHGWSATSEEIRPVPDRVAASLGANLYYARLTGHGQDGAALAAASAGAWLEDAAEAMAIGRRLGARVIVIGTSTGGTLLAAIAADPVLGEGLAGAAFVSPNFQVADSSGPLLTLPFARAYIPLLGGETRSWQGLNAQHDLYWTTSYPTVAVLPMAALVKYVRGLDYGDVTVPGLFIYTMQDTVVSHVATEQVAGSWGGAVTVVNPVVPADEPGGVHVLAGDIVSPARTDLAVSTLLDWVLGL